MKLSHLRNILAVAEHGSLRAASRHLDITQPAITRSIREIERDLGASLFERHAKGVRLTALGNSFVRRAYAVQAELRRAREEIDQLKGDAIGEVSVAVSTASGMSMMPSAVAAFRKRYPQASSNPSKPICYPAWSISTSGRIICPIRLRYCRSKSCSIIVDWSSRERGIPVAGQKAWPSLPGKAGSGPPCRSAIRRGNLTICS